MNKRRTTGIYLMLTMVSLGIMFPALAIFFDANTNFFYLNQNITDINFQNVPDYSAYPGIVFGMLLFMGVPIFLAPTSIRMATESLLDRERDFFWRHTILMAANAFLLSGFLLLTIELYKLLFKGDVARYELMVELEFLMLRFLWTLFGLCYVLLGAATYRQHTLPRNLSLLTLLCGGLGLMLNIIGADIDLPIVSNNLHILPLAVITPLLGAFLIIESTTPAA